MIKRSLLCSAAGLFTLAVFMLGIMPVALAKPKDKPSAAEEAKAKGEAPVAAQVDVVTLPAEPNLPKFAVAIKPFDYSASGQVSGGGQAAPMGTPAVDGETISTASEDGNQIVTRVSTTSGPNIGKGMAAQLRTALSGWPNISILPWDAITKGPDGTYSCKLQQGEVGPFVIEGTVTEFSETAESSGKGKKFDFRKLGWLVGLGGLAGGNRDVAIGGAAVGVAGPAFKNADLKRTGMVGMDLGILDGRIARYVGGGTFACQGSFTTVAKASNFSVLVVSSGKGEAAASSLGNATRAALNDALQKIHDAMTTVK